MTAPRPCRRAFSTRFASARSSAARSPRTCTGRGRRRSTPVDRAGQLVERHHLLGRAAASSRDSASRSSPAARAVACHLESATARRRAVPGQVGDIAGSAVSGVRNSCEASARNRRSPRGRARAQQHPFSVAASRPTSSSRPGWRQPPARIAGALDLGRRAASRVSGRSARRISNASTAAPAAAATSAAGGRAAGHSRASSSRSCGRGRDRHRATRRRPTRLGERRDVDTELLVAELASAVAPRPDAITRPQLADGEHAAAEPERARDDPAPTVEHLDDRLRAAERTSRASRAPSAARAPTRSAARPRPRAAEASGRASGAADGATSTSTPTPTMTSASRIASARPRSPARAERAHRSSTKPTPRTVSISGGSPSLRRR